MKTHRGHNCDISGSLKTNAISQLLSPLVFAMIFIYGCGGGGGGSVAVAPTPTVTIVHASQKKEFSIGGGVISPYKILDKKVSDGNMLVINGGGESGGAGHLFQVDSGTFAETRTRLDIGANPSDIIWVGNRVVVSCRGSDELYLVDVNEWRLLDSTKTVASPTSMAELPNNRLVVTGAVSNTLELYDVTFGRFEKVLSVPANDSIYHIVADPTGSFLYGNITSKGIVQKINARTLTQVLDYPVGGSPSFGSVMINNHLYVTDRDGYIRDINLQTGVIKSLDLAIPLNLDRSKLALRGIDPMDLVQIDDNEILVVNNRQKSVILTIAGNGDIQQASSYSQLSGGAYGAYVHSSGRIFITKPQSDSVIKYENINPGATPTETSFTTGRRIKSSVLINKGNQQYLAIMNSDDALVITNLSTRVENLISPPSGFVWHSEVKMSAWGDDRFAVAAIDGVNSIFEVFVYDALGTELFRKTLLNRNSIFSIEFVENAILVVSRMYNKVEIVNVENGTSQEIILDRSRPREAVTFDNGDWAVIHDTNPDIGYTLNHQNRSTFFPLQLASWPSDVLTLSGRRMIISSFTTGRILCINPDTGAMSWDLTLPFTKVDKLVQNFANSFWAVSPTSGEVALIDAANRQIVQVINAPSAIDVLPDYSNNGFWIVTEERLIQYEYDI